MLINFCLIFVLSSIVWQDFKYRKIYLAGIILMYLLLAVKLVKMPHIDWEFLLLNVILICIISISVILFFLFRGNFWQRIRASIGLGDILLLPLFIICFSFVNLLIFLIVSSIIAILFGIISKKKEIPLAGIQSLLMMPILVLEMFKIWNPLYDIIL